MKTKYDTDKSELENKITDTSGLVTEIEGKIPNISNSATKTALTTVENKIPKQIITLKLQKLKINLIIIITINILILQSLIK